MKEYHKTEWAKNNIAASSIKMDKIEKQLEILTKELIACKNNINEFKSNTELVTQHLISRIVTLEEMLVQEINCISTEDEKLITTEDGIFLKI